MSNAGEILNKVELDNVGAFTPQQIAKFKTDPRFYQQFIKAVEHEVNSNFPIVSAFVS